MTVALHEDQLGNLDMDMVNAFILLMSGTDMTQPTNVGMDDELFDALAFAQANDLNAFINTTEWLYAFDECVCDLIGQPTFEVPGMTTLQFGFQHGSHP